jgi:hypothetical protein
MLVRELDEYICSDDVRTQEQTVRGCMTAVWSDLFVEVLDILGLFYYSVGNEL